MYIIITIFHRPDYAHLSQLPNLFQNLPLMALTATNPMDGHSSSSSSPSNPTDGCSFSSNPTDGRSSSSSKKLDRCTSSECSSSSNQLQIRLPCTCRSQCNSAKHCLYRTIGSACLPECHVGHSCSNDDTQCTEDLIDLTSMEDDKNDIQ